MDIKITYIIDSEVVLQIIGLFLFMLRYLNLKSHNHGNESFT